MDEKTLVAGFLYNEGKVLLLRRSAQKTLFPRHFERPGGHQESTDPSLEDALVREVAQEAGLNVEIGLEYFSYSAVVGGTQYVEHSFLVARKDSSQQVRLSEEHDSYEWVRQEDLDKYLIDANERRAIEEGFLAVAKVSLGR